MLFFKRILKEPDLPAEPEEPTPAVERRSAKRFKVHPDSQLKAVFSFIGRDDTGAPMSSSRAGWNWRGRVIDCSEVGVRLQLGPVVKAEAGDEGELILEMQDFLLKVPCHVANVREQPTGIVFGLKHDINDEKTHTAFRQLVEVIALGSTLRRKFKRNKVDASGYLTEQYASDRPSRLTVWRNEADLMPAAFEFLLKDSLVRGSTGRDLQYLSHPPGADSASARPAALEKSREIYRLFQWVVPNVSESVPLDVRRFLLHYAT